MITQLLHFLDMGGYAIYVWPAYGLVLSTLAGQLLLSWQRLRKLNHKQQILHDE